jgi:Matrixin
MKNFVKSLLCSFIFIIINGSFVYPQFQEFEKFNPSTGNIDYTTNSSDPDLVYWDESVKSFGLSINSVDPATLPFELAFDNNVSTEETECIDEWNSYGCIQLQNYVLGGVVVEFSQDENIFRNNSEFGATLLAVEQSGNQYVFSVYPSNSISNYPFTAIYLNKTTDFYNSSFQWTSAKSNTGIDYIPFKPILLHEIGHLLGLGHNFNENYHTIMQATAIENQFVFSLTQTDKDGIAALCSLNGTPTTGIEDYINISLDLDTYNVNQTYVGVNNANFVDVFPYGDYITTWDNWQIKASFGCDEVLVWEGTGSGFLIPSLPNGYLWDRDGNGNVLATISIGGTDNDGFHHTASAPIKISNVPNTFMTSSTLTSNTSWCGTITLSGTVTVSQGVTLKVYPGSIIKFPSGASLIVNGKLDATGCTFTSQSSTSANSWGSIQLNGSGASGSVMDFCTMQYGNEVQAINVPNFAISHCNFFNNQIAIYVSGSTGSILNNYTSSNSIGHSIDIEGYSNIICSENTIRSSLKIPVKLKKV